MLAAINARRTFLEPIGEGGCLTPWMMPSFRKFMPRFREDHAVEIPRPAVSYSYESMTHPHRSLTVCAVCRVVVVVVTLCVCFGEGKEVGDGGRAEGDDGAGPVLLHTAAHFVYFHNIGRTPRATRTLAPLPAASQASTPLSPHGSFTHTTHTPRLSQNRPPRYYRPLAHLCTPRTAVPSQRKALTSYLLPCSLSQPSRFLYITLPILEMLKPIS